jgi:hypothetical protein
VVGLLALIPIVQAGSTWLLQRLPARHLLGLSPHSKLDIVVTTNATQRQTAGVADAYLTAVGEARGVAEVARVVARSYHKKAINVCISREYPGNPEGDILLLGGPRRNEWSKHFLRQFNESFGTEVDVDAEGRSLRLGTVLVEQFDQQIQGGVPTEDIGFVVIAPWEPSSKRRAILCAGLSTYGTEAAARFIFRDLLQNKRAARRFVRLVRKNEACVIGVRAAIAARIVQRTAVLVVDGKDVVWVGSPRPTSTP